MVSLMENADEDWGALCLISSRAMSLGTTDKTELAWLSTMSRQRDVQQRTTNSRTYLASQEDFVAHTELSAVLVGAVMVPGLANSK